MRLRARAIAYVEESDKVVRPYRIGGLFGCKETVEGFVTIKESMYALQSEAFYRKGYSPLFPWLGLREIQFTAIDYVKDNPLPIVRKKGVKVPAHLKPSTIASMMKSRALNVLHRKRGFDILHIALLLSVVLNIVVIVNVIQ